MRILASSPDGRMAAITSTSQTGVMIWNASSGQHLYSIPDEQGAITDVVWSPDGKRIAVARSYGDLSIWNLPQFDAMLSQIGLAP